jgi:hypothetical protein
LSETYAAPPRSIGTYGTASSIQPPMSGSGSVSSGGSDTYAAPGEWASLTTPEQYQNLPMDDPRYVSVPPNSLGEMQSARM